MANLRTRTVSAFVTVIILSTLYVLTVHKFVLYRKVTRVVRWSASFTGNATTSSSTSNATSFSSTSAAIVYTLSTNSTPPNTINETTITSSTPPTINDTTIITSTPSTIDSSNIVSNSSIDQYHAWIKTFNSSSLSFPLPQLVVSPKEILETKWAPELWRHLSELDTKFVSLCIGDSAYLESILNWLIAAMVNTKPPLENVLVISLDTKLHEVLQEHDINSVYVDIDSISRGPQRRFWLTRLVIFRLINYWGYTVATYDSDAIPVKNPEKLFAKFKDSDVIASRGTYPFELHKKWMSPTLCLGLAVFKASNETEKFWNFLSTLDIVHTDDQIIINTGFDMCHIMWRNRNKRSTSIPGRCSRDTSLTVTLLPGNVVCRSCTKKSQFYVWHELALKKQLSKHNTAIRAGMWYLTDKFHHKVDLKGLEWLNFIKV